MPDTVAGDPVNGEPQRTDTGSGGSTLTGGDPAPKTEPAPAQPQKPTWAAQLPKDLQSDEALTKFATIGDLWKGYRDLEGKVGKSIAVPGENATAEELAAYRKAIGVPEKPEDYKLEAKDLPEGVKLDEKLTAEFRAKAHELGMSQAGAEKLFAWYNQQVVGSLKASVESQKATVEAWQKTVRDQWGQNYEPNVRLARRAFAAFGGKELAEFMDKTGAGENPAVLEAFRAIGAAISESKLIEPKGAPGRKSDADVIYGQRAD